jgi:hypothetical protein
MTCFLITIAMQLTCAFENKVACTDNEALAELLDVSSCQELRLNVIPSMPTTSSGLHRAQEVL